MILGSCFNRLRCATTQGPSTGIEPGLELLAHLAEHLVIPPASRLGRQSGARMAVRRLGHPQRRHCGATWPL